MCVVVVVVVSGERGGGGMVAVWVTKHPVDKYSQLAI